MWQAGVAAPAAAAYLSSYIIWRLMHAVFLLLAGWRCPPHSISTIGGCWGQRQRCINIKTTLIQQDRQTDRLVMFYIFGVVVLAVSRAWMGVWPGGAHVMCGVSRTKEGCCTCVFHHQQHQHPMTSHYHTCRWCCVKQVLSGGVCFLCCWEDVLLTRCDDV